MSTRNTIKLTEASVRALKFPVGSNQREVLFFDAEVRGFHVRVYSTGHKAYRLKYSVRGKQRYKTLGPATPGRLAQARRRAEDIVYAARAGQDLVASEKGTAGRKTLGDLVEPYIEARKGKVRDSTLSPVAYYLRKLWKPLHSRFVDEVKRADVMDVLDKIESTNGGVSANRARSALSGFFDWAVDPGRYLEVSPVVKIKNRATNGGRDRVLGDDELREVWLACEAADAEALREQAQDQLPERGDPYSKIVRLLILTGQRKTEIGSLQRSEVKVESRRIELPSNRTKNGRPHIVPLASLAWNVLSSAKGQPYLFSRFDSIGGGFSGWSKAKAELDARITKARDGQALQGWTLHDLRRSFVTHMAEHRFGDPDLRELIVNHVSGSRRGVAGVYDRSERLEERKAALERWATWIEQIVHPQDRAA